MKNIFLTFLMFFPQISMASEGTEASALTNCDHCSKSPSGLAVIAAKVATGSNNSIRVPAGTTVNTGKSILLPNGAVRLPDGSKAAGGYVSPCLFMTIRHQQTSKITVGQINNAVHIPFDEISVSNEFEMTAGEPINFRPLKLVKTLGPLDATLYEDPTCAGGISGYFWMRPMQEQTQVIMAGGNGLSFDIKNECLAEVPQGPILIHSCNAVPGNSGDFLVRKNSISMPPYTDRYGVRIWDALGMQSKNVNGQSIAISAASLSRFIIKESLADSERYNSSKTQSASVN